MSADVLERLFLCKGITDPDRWYVWLEWPRLRVWCALPVRKQGEGLRELVERWAEKPFASGRSMTPFELTDDFSLEVTDAPESPFMPPPGSRLEPPPRLKRLAVSV
jgi:hypothetical protein